MRATTAVGLRLGAPGFEGRTATTGGAHETRGSTRSVQHLSREPRQPRHPHESARIREHTEQSGFLPRREKVFGSTVADRGDTLVIAVIKSSWTTFLELEVERTSVSTEASVGGTGLLWWRRVWDPQDLPDLLGTLHATGRQAKTRVYCSRECKRTV